MARKRKDRIPDRVKLAATLLRLMQPRADGQGFEYKIPREEWPKLTTEEIIGRFNFDHIVYEAIGGKAVPHNLDPIFKTEHDEKTPGDLRKIAKGKRIQKAEAVHAARVARKTGAALETEADTGERVERKPRWPRGSRPVPGGKATPYKRKLNGRTELRNAPARG